MCVCVCLCVCVFVCVCVCVLEIIMYYRCTADRHTERHGNGDRGGVDDEIDVCHCTLYLVVHTLQLA